MNKYLNKQTLVKDISLTLLSEGKTVRIKAHGYSMYPCIKPGSLLLIEPIQIKGMPKPGEIIAIKRENGLVVHRLCKIIVKDGIRWYVARGDSNSSADHPVSIDKITGRIIGAETTGENPVKADIRVNLKPNFVMNRLRVIGLNIGIRVKRRLVRPPTPLKGG